MKVANTILKQLGGNRFIAMTGARSFVGSTKIGDQFLRMDLPRNAGKVNRLKITLDEATDTYKMHFYKGRLCNKTLDYKLTNEQKFEGIYCDQLQEIFTQVTGFYTSL